jgi:hypothetical protein
LIDAIDCWFVGDVGVASHLTSPFRPVLIDIPFRSLC